MYYELSLCPVFPLHLIVLLKRFFTPRSFRAESASANTARGTL